MAEAFSYYQKTKAKKEADNKRRKEEFERRVQKRLIGGWRLNSIRGVKKVGGRNPGEPISH